MELDYIESLGLIEKLRDKELNDDLWDTWTSLYPYMMMGKLKFVDFNEYKDMARGVGKYRKKTVTEIYSDVDNIIEGFKINTSEEGD